MSDIVERALAFVRRKYIARENRGILYVEAAQDDLAKEIARFTAAEIARLRAENQALEDYVNGPDGLKAQLESAKGWERRWREQVEGQCREHTARIAELEAALEKIARYPSGGVIVEGTPEHDRDTMIHIARAALK